MSEESHATARLSFWARLGKAIAWLVRFTLRLLFVLIIGLGLGVGIYYGATFLYNQYILPVQVHSIRLDIMDARQEQDSQQRRERLDGLQARLTDLEVRGDTDKETIAGLQAQIEAAAEAQAAQAAALGVLEDIRADLSAMRDALETLQDAQDALQTDLEAIRSELASVQADQGTAASDLEALRAGQGTAEDAVEALAKAQGDLGVALKAAGEQVDALSASVAENSQGILGLGIELHGERSPAALYQELQLIKAMGFLIRGRLLLVQNNLGLAQSDIRSGRDLLVAMQSDVPAVQAQALAGVVSRLDAALENLPDAPVAAVDELEGAWLLLERGLPGALTAPSALEIGAPISPTLEITPTLALTATATLTVTPTLEVTPEITATATITPTTASGP
jgi:chaperonin cofactor prefoldin